MNDTYDTKFSVEVNITKSCNFRCSYCSEGDSCNETDDFCYVEESFSSIDMLLNDSWFVSQHQGIKIGFWGGEPTLKPELVKRFVERYKNNDNVNFFIFTNGYYVDRLIDIFGDVKSKTTIQVSYDGGYVNTKNRLLVSGEPTSDIVRDSIYTLHSHGFNIGIKSTMTYNDLDYIEDAWDDIKSINDDLGKFAKYSLTLDYTSDYDVDVDVVRKNFMKIAKKELLFYEKNGYHLFTWFGGGHTKCNFMASGMAIDTNGDLLYCHGCMYSPQKQDLVFGHITDKDIIDKIKKNKEIFILRDIQECGECIATNCITCNVQKHINSTKEGFLDKWYDLTCQKDQCSVFKEFGKIDRAVKDILGRK